MQVKSIYVNLPVNNLQVTRKFWNNLGFSFNEQFSDDKALCLVLNEGFIYAMLLSRDYFSTFTNKPVSDSTTTQVLLAIEVGSRENVDHLVRLALESGATRYRQAEDHGWMYSDSFADLDGHQWEILHANPELLQR